MTAAATPASATEALQMLESALGYLAAADATQMPTEVQAQCLQSFERADAVETAARASILGGLTAGRGYCQDGAGRCGHLRVLRPHHLCLDRCPAPGCQDAADAILVGAAQAGMDLPTLAGLAAEIQSKARPGIPDDDDPSQTFDDRAVRLETTFGGAGVLTGNLTPQCAAVVTAVLDALSAPKGA